MADPAKNDGVTEVRGHYGSLLDYFLERPASKDNIVIGLKVDEVPTHAQSLSLQELIRVAIGKDEIKKNLTLDELRRMEMAAG
ncbi:hypothetical protein EMCG_02557 [[Emmonsia] crescens]|uniref:Uncharacterized protein n=1 Tax=[Emmonsia] crescens TaxID=73230 RepID=A0A0G2J8Y8_9EURO|nr:hypothetical protein EMCG_02557 [Emmonsia crescens UAMH 3008]